MNKHDRQKMICRMSKDITWARGFTAASIGELARFVFREVDRAVRAERKAQRDTEDLRLSALVGQTSV
jgi:hypothetical protein